MDYEKAYKEALERAKELYEQGTITESLNYVFPELLESEDEKIRNQIITFIEVYGNPIHCEWQKDWIVWLEKQGQTFTQKDVDDAYLKGISDTKHELEKQEDSMKMMVYADDQAIISRLDKIIELLYWKQSPNITPYQYTQPITYDTNKIYCDTANTEGGEE